MNEWLAVPENTAKLRVGTASGSGSRRYLIIGGMELRL